EWIANHKSANQPGHVAATATFHGGEIMRSKFLFHCVKKFVSDAHGTTQFVTIAMCHNDYVAGCQLNFQIIVESNNSRALNQKMIDHQMRRVRSKQLGHLCD